MTLFKQSAIVVALGAALSGMPAAAQWQLTVNGADSSITYDVGSVEVLPDGTITLNDADIAAGSTGTACGPGTDVNAAGDQCVAEPVDPVNPADYCGSGTDISGGLCVADPVNPGDFCGVDADLVGGMCVGVGGGSDSATEEHCGPGTELDGGVCVVNYPPEVVSFTAAESTLEEGDTSTTITIKFNEAVSFVGSLSATKGTVSTPVPTGNLNEWEATYTKGDGDTGTAVITLQGSDYEDVKEVSGEDNRTLSLTLAGGVPDACAPIAYTNDDLPFGQDGAYAYASGKQSTMQDVPLSLLNNKGKHDGITALEFTTGNNPDYQVGFIFRAYDNTRHVWISECAGGPALDEGAWIQRCEDQGSAELSISVQQGPARSYCALETNTTYYINIENVTCKAGSKCDAMTMSYYPNHEDHNK
ncbi:Ig-like domain-containing protein [Gilvimarinus sp. 1_MG-2023]|uniref:Ig-like domain-containing protein n=1 Tax=Gilvimarinus sp. 1_MG-2023 TaxID=3062638 RepID=UPI0026E2D667|nr:Ig-like domain-containing protein [Gilvimarinus sp. 1_MG-2023]MDO6746799.1 Ig-like domain-containing protein [Gilvimarinus sp. 1_MG-2023]